VPGEQRGADVVTRKLGIVLLSAGSVVLLLLIYSVARQALDVVWRYAVAAILVPSLIIIVLYLPGRLTSLDLRAIEKRTLSASEYLEAVNHRRSVLLTAVGGVLLLLSAYFTWSQLQLSAEGQVTDRFTKAVDQLGDKDREVRLGVC
jgi:hypothetical protein